MNCPSCGHDLDFHELNDDVVYCHQLVDEGCGYMVDCWACELEAEELVALKMEGGRRC